MQKLTMLINSNGGIACGWSETMYTSLSDGVSTRSLAQAWMTARSQLLSGGYQIQGVRITSDPTTPPVYSYLYLPAAPITGVQSPLNDYPNTAVLISLRSGQATEHRDLRGWPDSMIASPAAQLPVTLTPAGQGLLTTYLTYLSGASLGWARLARPGDTGYLAVPIDTIAADVGSGLANVFAAFGAGFIGANKGAIRVRGFKDNKSFLNGVYQTNGYAIISTQATLGRPITAQTAVGYVAQTARVIKQVLIYATVQSGAFERVSSHRTGRPFAQLRGRR